MQRELERQRNLDRKEEVSSRLSAALAHDAEDEYAQLCTELCVAHNKHTDLLNQHSALEVQTLGLESQLIEARDGNMELQARCHEFEMKFLQLELESEQRSEKSNSTELAELRAKYTEANGELRLALFHREFTERKLEEEKQVGELAATAYAVELKAAMSMQLSAKNEVSTAGVRLV